MNGDPPRSRTDVFVCTQEWKAITVKGWRPLRHSMLMLAIRRWKAEKYNRVQVLRPKRFTDPVLFQRERRIMAENMVVFDPNFYVLADDDCMPSAGADVRYAKAILHQHPEFAILSYMPDNEFIVRWTPEGYQAFVDQDVLEHVSVGGIRVMRAGIVNEDMPPMNGPGYDAIQADWLRSKGYRVGYFRNITMCHIGKGYSTVWKNQSAS